MRWRRPPRAAAADPRVDRVLICTPDKDLAQSVRGTRVVQMDRRARTIRDEAGVVAKFGVPPASIPDYLALVGDASDGFPGLPGWGAKSAAAVLAKYGHLESIPPDWTHVGRERHTSGRAGRNVLPRTRSSVPVSRSRDAPNRHPALRHRRRPAMERTHASFPAARRAAGRRGDPTRQRAPAALRSG